MVRRQTRVQKRNRRQQNKSRRNNRRQNKSLRRKRQSRRKLRGGVIMTSEQQKDVDNIVDKINSNVKRRILDKHREIIQADPTIKFARDIYYKDDPVLNNLLFERKDLKELVNPRNSTVNVLILAYSELTGIEAYI